MKESDLYLPIKKWVQDNYAENVYAEVANIDVVGVNTDKNIITTVEMKLGLSFKVIEQAIRSAKYGHFNYIAIPKPKKAPSYLALKLLKEHSLGLLYVSESYTGKYTVKEFLPCSKNVVSKRYNICRVLKPLHLNLIGGVKSGDGDTPYSLMIDEIVTFLEGKNFTTIEDIIENVPSTSIQYTNPKKSLSSTLCANWNKDKFVTCIIKNKKYYKNK